MRRDFLLSLVAFLIIVTGVGTFNGAILALGLIFLVYLAAALIFTPGKPNLTVTRHANLERVPTGAPVEVTVTITNQGGRLEEVLVDEDLPEGLVVVEGSSRHILHLGPGQQSTWTYKVSGKRGYYIFSPVQIEARDPFGLIVHRQKANLGGHLFIMPPVLKLKPLMIRPRRTRVYSGIVPARVGGSGVEFYGLREYQPGDSPRWINWRASARQPENLVSNEFQQERVADIGIILDGRTNANLDVDGHSLFEYSSVAAATIASTLLQQGNRVGMLVYGRFLQWTIPGYGKLQREKILQDISQAQPGSSQVFADLEHIPSRLFPSQSQLVLISPLVPEDHRVLVRLRARGYQLMVVSPDPVAFEASLLPKTPPYEQAARVIRMERELLLHKLRRAGIQLVSWDITQPFDQVMRARLGRPSAWIPPTAGGLR